MDVISSEQRLCRCGCGATIPPFDKRGRRRFYLTRGHAHRASHRPSDEDLRRLYCVEGMGCPEIGARYGVHDTTVRKWLLDLDIPLRPIQEANRLAGVRRDKYAGPTELADLYLIQKLNSEQIASRYGVRANTVRGWLQRAGIPRRSRSEAHRMVYDLPRPSDDELVRMYEQEEMSGADIAKSLGVDVGTALNWLRAAGITIRSLSETQRVRNKRREAQQVAALRDVSVRTRYAVLARDGFRCCACGRSPKLHGIVLQVDHIHPRSKGGSNDATNLQALCADCNLGKSDR